MNIELANLDWRQLWAGFSGRGNQPVDVNECWHHMHRRNPCELGHSEGILGQIDIGSRAKVEHTSFFNIE